MYLWTLNYYLCLSCCIRKASTCGVCWLSKLPTARAVATEVLRRPSSGFLWALCRKPFQSACNEYFYYNNKLRINWFHFQLSQNTVNQCGNFGGALSHIIYCLQCVRLSQTGAHISSRFWVPTKWPAPKPKTSYCTSLTFIYCLFTALLVSHFTACIEDNDGSCHLSRRPSSLLASLSSWWG